MKYLHCLGIASALLVAGCAAPSADRIGGTRPAYLESTTESVPNAQALRSRIWTPGLEENFVPQGLTTSGRYLFISGYTPSPDLKSNTGPCRIFRVHAETGDAAGGFDLPPGTCTHAGGLAHVGQGRLLLADTRELFLIDIEKALASGTAAGAYRSVRIAGELRGSYAGFDGKDPWIGTWTREAPKAKMFRIPLGVFEGPPGRTITETSASASQPVPLEAQGLTFDKSGDIWVSVSNGAMGRLHRLDRTGNPKAVYEMPAGLEDLAVDDAGHLWGVSESGTRKYLQWATRFPYVFRIDVQQLK